MQKEIVKIENIKEDILARYREIFILHIRAICGSWLAFTIWGWIFFLSGRGNLIIVITMISTIVIFATRALFFLTQNNHIKKGKITVERDVVVDKRGMVTNLNYKGRSILFYNNTPRFYFSQGSVFRMENIDYYTWSNRPRTLKTIFDVTDIGDSFIIVKYNRKIQIVYNERFFELYD